MINYCLQLIYVVFHKLFKGSETGKKALTYNFMSRKDKIGVLSWVKRNTFFRCIKELYSFERRFGDARKKPSAPLHESKLSIRDLPIIISDP